MASKDLPLQLDYATPTWTSERIALLVSVHTFREQDFILPDADEASTVMELLQMELDRASRSRAQYRKKCLKLMQHLNRVHGVFPPSMHLKGLVCESRTAVAGGGFADVWIGRLDDRRVCIKVLRFFQQGSDRMELQRALSKEVLLWRQLSHPNILPFLGINNQLFSPSFCIISPWMTYGDIITYSQKRSLDLGTKLKHLVQIAQGLDYLHGLDPPVVHGDIKGANILISDDYQCCLADFGLSVLDTQSANPSHTATAQGSLRWLAPEFIHPPLQSTQPTLTPRDVYAFGCTVFELLTGKPPFSDHTLDISVALDVLRGIRPVLLPDTVPPTIFVPLRSLLDRCWSEKILQRPNAQELLQYIDYFLIPMLGPSGLDISSPALELKPLAPETKSHKSESSSHRVSQTVSTPNQDNAKFSIVSLSQDSLTSIANMFTFATPDVNLAASLLPVPTESQTFVSGNNQERKEERPSPIEQKMSRKSNLVRDHIEPPVKHIIIERISKNESNTLNPEQSETSKGSWWSSPLFRSAKRLWKQALTRLGRHKKTSSFPARPTAQNELFANPRSSRSGLAINGAADIDTGVAPLQPNVYPALYQARRSGKSRWFRTTAEGKKGKKTVRPDEPENRPHGPEYSASSHDHGRRQNHRAGAFDHAFPDPLAPLLDEFESELDVLFNLKGFDIKPRLTATNAFQFLRSETPTQSCNEDSRSAVSVDLSRSDPHQPGESNEHRGSGGGLSWDDPDLQEAWNRYCQRQDLSTVRSGSQ